VQVQCEGQTGNTVSLKVVPRAPQILSITDTAYNPRDAKHAARAGESLIIWTIGMGPTTPAVPAGVPAPANPPAVVAVAPLVLFGAGTVTPSFAGLAPGQIGLYQVNFTVPANSPKGVVSVKCGFRFDYFSDSVSLAIQ
jgi:uncharacterized protein (TIGR03437 family)